MYRQNQGIQRDGGGFPVDGGTYVGGDTFEIAWLAAGGGEMVAGGLVMSAEFDNAYALVRPPGHHARRGRQLVSVTSTMPLLQSGICRRDIRFPCSGRHHVGLLEGPECLGYIDTPGP